jgi:hypothetical protein
MAMSVKKLEADLNEELLRESILRNIRHWNHACAPDLAGLIGHGVTVDRLIPVLESLVREGVLKHMEKESRDPRDYTGPNKTRYGLAA